METRCPAGQVAPGRGCRCAGRPVLRAGTIIRDSPTTSHCLWVAGIRPLPRACTLT